MFKILIIFWMKTTKIFIDYLYQLLVYFIFEKKITLDLDC